MKLTHKVNIALEITVPVMPQKDFDLESFLLSRESELVTRIFESIDKRLSDEYVSRGYRVIRTRKRRLKTIFGILEFRYRVLKKGDINIVPLLKYLNLSKNQRVSNFLRGLTAFIAIEYPYRKVERIISDMRKVNVSHASIRSFLLASDYKTKRKSRILHK